MGKVKKILISFKNYFIVLFKWFLYFSGGFAFVFFVLSFTDLPYYAYHRLGTSNSKINKKPDLIVILGGGGMPSPDGLIRTYYGAHVAHEYPKADVIIALPYDMYDSLYQLNLMAQELRLKGIDSLRIKFEPFGFNTHSQAENIAKCYNTNEMSILIVTSPEHMYRAVRTFRKVGFLDVSGYPTFENPVAPEKIKDNIPSKDVRVKSLALRYNMWSYMNYELLVMREYFAILYYKIKGWI